MKKKTIYQGKIPFDTIKEYTNYVTKEIVPARIVQSAYEDSRTNIWKDNLPFTAILNIESYSRGRSAANWDITLHDVVCTESPEYATFLDGMEVNVFMVDMLDIIKSSTIVAGKVVSRLNLCFSKRGMNYGMCLVPNG